MPGEGFKSRASTYRYFLKRPPSLQQVAAQRLPKPDLVSFYLILNTLDRFPLHKLKQCLLNPYKPLTSVATYGKKFCSLTTYCVKTTSLICSEYATC